MIEGVFARGDRRLAKVLYQAWKDGAKFDGWTDLYQHETWLTAMEKCGIDGKYYSQRTRNFDEALPWAITSPGVNAEFLLREWHKAMNAALTEDCRRGKCSACGICPNLGVHVVDYAKEEAAREYEPQQLPQKVHRDPKDSGRPRMLYAYRAEITKGEELRYVSHLDYANIFIRAFKRSGLPMAYSEGFNHHMKIAFASALSLGVTSEAEYMEFELLKPVCQPEVFDKLSAQLPPGIELKELREVKTKQKALMAQATEARYRVLMPLAGEFDLACAAVKKYNEAHEVQFQRVTPKKKRDIELKAYMLRPVAIEALGDVLQLDMDIAITQSGSVKPIEVIHALAEQFSLPANPAEAKICRTAMLADGKRLVELV